MSRRESMRLYIFYILIILQFVNVEFMFQKKDCRAWRHIKTIPVSKEILHAQRLVWPRL